MRKWLIYHLLVKPELWRLIGLLRDGKNLSNDENTYVNVLAMFELEYLGKEYTK